MADIAEIALGASCYEAFAHAVLECLAEPFGADAAAMAVADQGAKHVQVVDIAGEQALLSARLPLYVSEGSPDEMTAARQPRVLTDDEIFTCDRRRQRLLLYSEYMQPRALRAFALRLWAADRGGLHWFALSFTCGSLMSRRGRDRICRLDQAFPVIAMGVRLHTAPRCNDQELDRRLTADFRITESEHRVLALLERGLTNPEIAMALGISRNTVRNRLAAAFDKLNVSRRSEAVFILRTSAPILGSTGDGR